jgi:hypothetical protein
MSKYLVIIGLTSLLHAAYSAAQHRSYLRLAEQEFDGLLPFDVILQALVSLMVAMVGIVSVCGQFKEIRALDDLKDKSLDTIQNRPNFYIFNHRGRLLRW